MQLYKLFEENVIKHANDQWVREDYLNFAESLIKVGVCDKNIINIVIGDKDTKACRDIFNNFLLNVKCVAPSHHDAARIYAYFCCSKILQETIDPVTGAKELTHSINFNEGDSMLEIEMIAGELMEMDYKLEKVSESKRINTSILRVGCLEILKWAKVAFDKYEPIYEKWKSSRGG